MTFDNLSVALVFVYYDVRDDSLYGYFINLRGVTFFFYVVKSD